jgi:hypothetical protein
MQHPPPVPSNVGDKGKEVPYVVQRTRVGQFVGARS